MRKSKRYALLLPPLLLLTAGAITTTATGGTAAALSAPTSTTTATSGFDALPSPPGFTASELVFDDQFKGTTLNTSYWNTYVGGQGGGPWWGGTQGVPVGWSATGAHGQTVYSPANVSVNDGLTLRLSYDGGNQPWDNARWHTIGGAISTYNKVTFQGSFYVQVRAKLPPTEDGQWPAIWLLPNGPPAGGGSQEIDMDEGGMIGTGNVPARTSPNSTFTPNYIEPDGSNASGETGAVPSFTLNAGYHTYGMQIIAGRSVSYYLDGALVWTDETNVPNDTWELIINIAEIASGVGWHVAAPYDMSTLPASFMHVAEVQVYS